MKKEAFITYILEILGWINEKSTQNFAKTHFVSVYGYLNKKLLPQEQANLHYWYVEFLLSKKLQQTEVIDDKKFALWFYDNLHRVVAKKNYISLIYCDVLDSAQAKNVASQMLKEGIFDIDSMKTFLQAIQIVATLSPNIDVNKAQQYFQVFQQKIDSYSQGQFTHIAHYRIVSELGRGGMGIVFKALDTKLNRFVALKVITNQRVSQISQRRFTQEIKAVAALQHENIVQIFDSGQTPNMYFAMEFINGKSLRNHLPELQDKFQECAGIVKKLCSALQFVHNKRMIHRDIKPDNVMIDGKCEPKLMDFGLAKMIDQHNSLSRQGDVVGTPFYMSPEQAKGEKVDERSDIYSLGASFYQMLTGRTPFRSNEYVQIVYKICNDEPIAPRALNPDIPKDLELICLKCLEKNKDHRYQSARELQQDIENYLHHKPISVKVSVVHNLRKWCYRHKFLTASMLLTIVFMSVIGWFLIEKWKTNEHLTRLITQLKINSREKQRAFAQLENNNVEKQKALTKSQQQLATAHIKMAEYQFLQRKMSTAREELLAAKTIAKNTNLSDKQQVYIDLFLRYGVEPSIPVLQRNTTVVNTSTIHQMHSNDHYVSYSLQNRIYVWKREQQTFKKSNAIVIKGKKYNIHEHYLVCLWQNSIKVVDLRSMRIKNYPFSTALQIHGIAFSARTQWVAIKAFKTQFFVHLPTAKKIEVDTKHHISDSNPMYFNKKGDMLLSGIESSIANWKLENSEWKIVDSVSFLGRDVSANCISPDRKLLIYGDERGELTIVNFADRINSRLNYHKTRIEGIAFNERERLFATAERESKIILWDRVSLKPIGIFDSGLRIKHIYFIGKQIIAVAGLKDNQFTYQEWLVEKNLVGDYHVQKRTDLIEVLEKLGISTTSAFRNLIYTSCKGKYIAINYNMIIFLWEKSGGAEKFFAVDNNFLQGEVHHLCFSPDEKKMAVTYTNGRIVVVNIEGLKIIADIKPASFKRGVQEGFTIFSTDSSHLIFTQKQKNEQFMIFSYHLQNATKNYIGKTSYIITKHIVVDNVLVIGTMVGRIEMYTISRNSIKKYQEFITNTNTRTQALAWMPDKLAIYLRNINAVHLYKKHNNTFVLEKSIPMYGEVTFLSFSPDHKKLAIFQEENIYIYDVQHHCKVEVMPGYYKGGAAVVSKEWSFLAVPSSYGNIITMKISDRP